jgi:hypothetical protein
MEDDASNEDLANLALGDAAEPEEDESDQEASNEEETFWGSFKEHVPQAKELAELRASLTAKEAELATALASRKLQLEDLFDEDIIRGLPADEIEELAAALYFAVNPDKVDKEIAANIKAKRDSIANRREKEKSEEEVRTKLLRAREAEEDAHLRSYQADLREVITDNMESLPSLLRLAGGNRASLAKLVYEEVLEAVESGIAKTAEDVDPEFVLAGLERRARKVLQKTQSATAPRVKKEAIAKGSPRAKRQGIFG